MKITICGSIAFYEEMKKIKADLEKMGHEVDLPPSELKDNSGNNISVQEYYKLRRSETDNESWIWRRKKEAIEKHFDKIAWGDCVLIANYEKNGVKGYVGANTLIEMGLALYLDKKIFLLNPIPEISYKEEILGLEPIVLNGDLNKIN